MKSEKQRDEYNEQALRNLEIGDSAWLRYVTKKGTTFVFISRLAHDWFKLSHGINGMTVRTLNEISSAIVKSKEFESLTIGNIG